MVVEKIKKCRPFIRFDFYKELERETYCCSICRVSNDQMLSIAQIFVENETKD